MCQKRMEAASEKRSLRVLCRGGSEKEGDNRGRGQGMKASKRQHEDAIVLGSKSLEFLLKRFTHFINTKGGDFPTAFATGT